MGLLSPAVAIGEMESFERICMHLDAIAGRFRRHVSAVADHDGTDKMLMQMIDIFEYSIIKRCRHADIIEYGNMLDVLTQTNAARMRTHRHAELRSHQQYDDHFVQAA